MYVQIVAWLCRLVSDVEITVTHFGSSFCAYSIFVSGFCNVGPTNIADLTRETIDDQKSEVVASGAERSMEVRALTEFNKRDSNISVAGDNVKLCIALKPLIGDKTQIIISMMHEWKVEAVVSSKPVQVLRFAQKSAVLHLDQDPEAGKWVIEPTTCDVPHVICVEEVWLVDSQCPFEKLGSGVLDMKLSVCFGGTCFEIL